MTSVFQKQMTVLIRLHDIARDKVEGGLKFKIFVDVM